ncbi:MAG TPA: sigma-54 dependent transcriptional regulator [Candidatus Paceibacterota bacterium]|nr:sigma-54 dependent transcriptional regulator [Candidatus Paceibacterota bacterium]
MSIEKIVVLEDDLIVRKNLEHQLRQRRYDVASVSTIADAQDYLNRDNFDLVFLDVRLPDGDGTELLKAIQQKPLKPLVVMTTGFGSVESAVECMKNGAFDYLIKPFSAEQIEVVLKKAEEFTQLLRVNRFLSQENEDSGYELLGSSPAMDNVRQLIRKVARTLATVLIQGESGTGKELVARAIYRESARANAPFIRVNCAAIPENLIESEFFGHEKGAFTGALNKREGRFELAHGGTILLDEISEISPSVQAKLLRVLQERELERVGGNRTIKVDVRVIATTNRHLEQSVQKKEFREDLFFRLNVVPIHVPPLRERKEDVIFLAEEFMRRFSRKHGIRVNGFSDPALRILKTHEWPGNVRELQNVIERAVILCGEGGLLEADHLGLGISASGTESAKNIPTTTAQTSSAAGTGTEPTVQNGDFLEMAEMEKRHILRALERCNGNRTHAAKLLKISIRTLRNKLSDYNVGKGEDEEEAVSDE